VKVEEVLVAKGYLSRSAIRSAVQASVKRRVPLESLLLSAGAITEQKLKEALLVGDEELEEIKDRRLFLRRTPLFSQIDARALQEIAATVSWEWFPRDHVIVGQGARTADFYVVQSGRVKVCVSEGEREKTLAVLSRGECFGEMSLLSGGATTATVRAAEPTLCLKQGQKQFLEMMNRYPTLHRFFGRLFVERARTIYKELLLDSYPFVQPASPSAASGQAAYERPVIILTLGRFGIIRKGKPIVFAGKAQKKPLLLLKALICLGGRQVREGAITELLWPDSEADAAHSAFSTTLSRLRGLLGSQKAIEISEGKARIDPDYVWIDVWEFERLCKQADGQRSEGAALPAKEAMQTAIRLYEGHFLASDDEFWALSVRENLRNRFVRLVSKFGEVLERQDDWERALELYGKALEIDQFVEEFYQRLMACYQKRGCRAEAIAVYERCVRMLSMEFGISPSDKTLAIIGKIRSRTE